MESAAILSKLNQIAGKWILERQKFGRSGDICVWVEARSLAAFARSTRSDSELSLDWLESLSAMHLDGAIVLSYFLRSYREGHQLIFRASVSPRRPQDEVEFPSVRAIWPMAESFESEISDLFGAVFVDEEGKPVPRRKSLLPEGWRGYPLRKDYIFPTEVYGISHSGQPAAPEEGGNA